MRPDRERGPAAWAGRSLATLGGALISLAAVCIGYTSTVAPRAAGEPRKVTACRFEAVHYEEVWRCAPNPAEPGRPPVRLPERARA